MPSEAASAYVRGEISYLQAFPHCARKCFRCHAECADYTMAKCSVCERIVCETCVGLIYEGVCADCDAEMIAEDS